jgi:hypothetical protein
LNTSNYPLVNIQKNMKNMDNHQSSLENSLFLWWFSIVIFLITRGYNDIQCEQGWDPSWWFSMLWWIWIAAIFGGLLNSHLPVTCQRGN